MWENILNLCSSYKFRGYKNWNKEHGLERYYPKHTFFQLGFITVTPDLVVIGMSTHSLSRGVWNYIKCIKMLGISWVRCFGKTHVMLPLQLKNSHENWQLSYDHCPIWHGLPSCPTIFGSLLLKSCPHVEGECFFLEGHWHLKLVSVENLAFDNSLWERKSG